ncbi:MAG: amidohydrolase [Clostridiales Family XIII bacterium]|jgi:5-methylthioadenosine/S-adenosylhomocysteine deaminase|nr:amidohydrolase [Clostridiales Family XIII bacterium]
MLFSNVNIMDAQGQVTENAYLGTAGERISYIGASRPEGDFGRAIDGRGKLLMPGFYNAHAHSPMTLLRGYGENMRLQEWLNARIFPFEDRLDGNAVYWGTMLAMAESMRFGIVSTTDMYNFCDEMARAVADSGMKANISRALLSFDPGEDIHGMESFRECRELYGNWNGAEGGRLIVDMSIHAEYTSTPRIVSQLAEYAGDVGANMHVHVSETESEHEGCKERHGGMTPVEYFSSLGLFGTRTTAAHCVWLSEHDMELLAEKGVTVASCPVSNMKLASGVCNVPLLLEKGVNVAIGTDGAASNNSLNYIEEMKFFALANKVMRGDPTLVSPAETLRAATLAGARSQGRSGCGDIAVGARADLIALDLSVPNMRPIHDLASNVVYSACGSDVALTMVDGRIVYENGKHLTIDVERAVYETERAKDRILGELR